MSTAAHAPAAPGPAAAGPTASGRTGSLPPAARTRVTLGRVMRSEWIKFWSLRSTYWTLGAAVFITVGLGALLCAANAHQWQQSWHGSGPFLVGVDRSLRGYLFAQIAVGVLGVLMFSGEFGTGMIRTSVAAVPRRLPLLTAKAAVFALVTWVVATLSALVAVLVGHVILAPHHLAAPFSAPGVARAVFGTGLYLTAIGLLAVGLGAMLRNTAAAVSALFAVLLVIPIAAAALPTGLQNRIDPYLPSEAGSALASLDPDPHQLAPWHGFGVMCIYVVVSLVGAALLLRRRDA